MTRLIWRPARLVQARQETASARTLVLAVEGWPGHDAGQHVDVRLTADDGYTAQRSYSIAAPAAADRLEVTVQRVPDGEVSPYLVEGFEIGDAIEVRGPIGGWFVWRPELTLPLTLVAGGSGIVPLMAMLRARGAASAPPPCHLVYSVRAPGDVLYADELSKRAESDGGLRVSLVFTRAAPEGWARSPRRLTAADIPPAAGSTRAYVCGPTGFVEHAAQLLISAGFDPQDIRTERFGPTGG